MAIPPVLYGGMTRRDYQEPPEITGAGSESGSPCAMRGDFPTLKRGR